MPDRRSGRPGDDSRLDVEERFAVVPEWLLDSPVSDCAVRLYAVLLRYGQVSGARMPSRATLTRRMHKKSTYTVDRAAYDGWIKFPSWVLNWDYELGSLYSAKRREVNSSIAILVMNG